MIFVSYRRQDTQGATGRLCDKLQQRFGDEAVFRDVESIDAGADFVATITAMIEASAVVLVIIGARWLQIAGAIGRPRIHDPDDYVFLEITTALQRNVPIIPVLVEGATMPVASALPPAIAGLARRQAHEISEHRWQYDTDRLLEQLEKHVAPVDEPLEPKAPLSRTLLDAVIRCPSDFVQLLVRPRGQLARILQRRARLTSALVFFTVSHIVAAWLFVLPEAVESVPAFVLSGVPLGSSILVFLLVPLQVAARIARIPSHAPSTMVVLAYIQSVFAVLVATGVALIWTGLTVADPTVLQALRDIMYANLPVDVRIGRLVSRLEPAVRGPFLGAFALTNVIWLYAVGWLLVAGSAIQHVWKTSYARLAVALVLFGMMLSVAVALVGFAATR